VSSFTQRRWAQSSGPQGAKSLIQKLCDRVASSTLLDDRRDAVRALKSLSKASGGGAGRAGPGTGHGAGAGAG
uniref:Uncharacterized protein n=1 Tax=Anas platyrhynchos platyrhynchos TaxID=8840 RepID=A0A493ST53_ANAPP